MAAHAAAVKPDLLIHVGDYLYREDMCPLDSQAKCGGTATGDNWLTWNADFFAPAAKLLASAPWAVSRGNHEDCQRAWRGWFYYLDPHEYRARVCQSFPAPYQVTLGKFEMVMLDSSAATEGQLAREQVRRFTAQFRSLQASNAWLVAHHPFWRAAVISPLAAAWDRAAPKGIELVVSGHYHLFELLGFDQNRPPQLIAGDGGTTLDLSSSNANRDGVAIHGARVVANEKENVFGYTLLTKSVGGWNLLLQDPAGKPLVACSIRGTQVQCRAVGK